MPGTGERWIIETLTDAHGLRGWALERITADSQEGILHVALTDHYGRVYQYRIQITEETP